MANIDFSKLVILVLTFNLLLFVGGVRVVDTDTNDFLNRFVNTTSYEVDGVVVLDDSFKDAVPTNYGNTQVGDFITFIDAIAVIASFLIFLVNILFTPIGLFMGTGLPAEVGLLVGVPMVVGLVLGFIYFLRSGK